MGLLLAKVISLHRNGRAVLDRIDVTIQRGAFVGLIGPNGAGKTTLLRVMAKLLEPTRGAVFLDNAALACLRQRDVARQIAMVPQAATAGEFAFPVLDVVLMGRYPHRGRFESETPEDRAVAREAIAVTRTEEFVDRLITELSGGERQLVALARALAQQPRLLLLDEPTANLDLCHQIEILKLVRRLVDIEGLTVVAAIHDLELASRYCDRLLLLKSGSLVADGPPDMVLTQERLAEVFGVVAQVRPAMTTGGLAITVLDVVSNTVTNKCDGEAVVALQPSIHG